MKKGRLITKGEEPLELLLNTHLQLHERIFRSTSILLIITSIILSVTTGFFMDKFISLNLLSKVAVLVLVFSSLVALIICLFIIRPELKHKEEKTEFYYMDVIYRFSKEKYIQRLYQLLREDKGVIKLIVDEFYELGEKVLLPNFKKIKLATEILIVGIIISATLFILSIIFQFI